MAQNNPLRGGPDFVKALVNTIESTPNAYSHPPQTRGMATSIRLPKERVAFLDVIADATNGKWTRNDVVNSLLDKGLFVLFEQINDAEMKKIMDQAAHQILPPMHETLREK